MSTAITTIARLFTRPARLLTVAGASLAFVAGSVEAQGHGSRRGGHGYHGGHSYHGGHHGHRSVRHWRGGSGWVWGGVGLGLGLGLASHYASPWGYAYSEPQYVIVNPPPVVYESVPPVLGQPVYSQPVPARSPQPVIYPRDGQSPAKMDADADACSEWAGQQPNATTDRSVFFRATQACMDARGYTVR